MRCTYVQLYSGPLPDSLLLTAGRMCAASAWQLWLERERERESLLLALQHAHHSHQISCCVQVPRSQAALGRVCVQTWLMAGVKCSHFSYMGLAGQTCRLCRMAEADLPEHGSLSSMRVSSLCYVARLQAAQQPSQSRMVTPI